MKRLFLLCGLLSVALCGAAQSRYVAVEGLTKGSDGWMYSDTRSTLAVDVQVEKERILAGPYARYALKYLGLSAPFSDKTIWRITGAAVALGDEHLFDAQPLAAPVTTAAGYGDRADAFAQLPVDRFELLQTSPEQAAERAANRIFALRRARLDLITGEAGEHVFGEGLSQALAEIDRLEQQLLELFLGKKYTTVEHRRFVVIPKSDKRQYILCRFSESDGLLPADDLSGDIVALKIAPEAPFEVEQAEKGTLVPCRVAAPSLCTVQAGGQELAAQMLPLFTFGRKVSVVAPKN